MSVYDLGRTDALHNTFIYMASDGSQRFDRADVDKAIAGGAVPGTVMTEDELRKWIDDEISRNQEHKKTLEDLIKDSCVGWSSAKFKFAEEPKLYSYYEFIEEMERRSEQNGKAVQGGGNGFPDPDAENSSGCLKDGSKASAVPDGPNEPTVSEEQIALLFTDGDISGTGKTAREYWEQSFERIGAHAPETVKVAWLEAAEAAGVDGMGVSRRGKLTHISQMMIQRCVRWHRGEDGNDMLGSSVQSAVRVAQKALYDLEHPLEPGRAVSPEKRQNMAKEKKFYLEFLKRLQD